MSGIYTSTEMSNIFGLSQLFSQGRTGIGKTIAVVEFEQYLASDVQAFQSCYGLSNPIRNEVVDGPIVGSPEGSGEAALDVELAAYNAAGVVARRLRGAQQQRRGRHRPVPEDRQ